MSPIAHLQKSLQVYKVSEDLDIEYEYVEIDINTACQSNLEILVTRIIYIQLFIDIV